MRVLVACRLMSGFAGSVRAGAWRPTGAPAFANLFAALADRGDAVRIVFTVREAGFDFAGDWPEARDRDVALTGLDASVRVLAGVAAVPRWLGRLRGHASAFRQTMTLLALLRRERPDIFYVDRGNVFAGALAARLTRVPVVLRVLGVTPAMREIAVGRAPSLRLARWAWRSPFRLVVGTNEGSGTARFLSRVLRPEVRRIALVNGVARVRDEACAPPRRPDGERLRVLFVGRLEALKGADEFVDAMLRLPAAIRARIAATVVGGGSLEAGLRARAEAAGATAGIAIRGAVPHDEVASLLRDGDVYVSLNRQGNLSNANLEALTAGLCMVLPEPDAGTGADLDTGEIIPDAAAIRIARDDMASSLAAALAHLVDHSEEVHARRQAALAASRALPSWPQRMDRELRLLDDVASGRGVDVAVVISDLGAGGAQRVATRLAGHWTGAGRRLAFVTLGAEDTDFHALPEPVQRVALGETGVSRGVLAGLAANLRRVRALRRALRALRPAVVLSLVGPTNVLAVLATRGLGCRVVVSERNDPSRQSFGRIWDALRRLAYRRAALVTANSKGALDALTEHVPATRLAYVPNPLPAPERAAQGQREWIVLAVGRLHRQKAFDVLLPAFAMAARDRPAWRLVIIGDGEERKRLRDDADSLGIGHRVEWTGVVGDVGPWYRRASVFALPSRHEGMPNALLEAMAHGLPPVITDALPGPLELVRDGESGLVVRAEDVADLAAALARLMDDTALRGSLGAAAQARVAPLAGEAAYAAWDAALGLAPQRAA
ncbi:MAG: glycosyltransferase [Alphaproteobacteria bacterium]